MDTLTTEHARVALSSGLAGRGVPGGVTGGVKSFEAARVAAVELESQFLSQMLAPMFENLGAEAPFGGGIGEEMWRSMQVQEFGKGLSRAGGIGLADHILGELLALQEKESGR